MKTKLITHYFPLIKNYLLLILMFLCLFSCTSINEKKVQPRDANLDSLLSSIKAVDKQFSPDTRSVYLILPNEGCEGCISTAEQYVLSNFKKNENMKFIFTRITSKKILKAKLTDSVLRYPNILLDTINLISFPDKSKSIYPLVVLVEKGNVVDLVYQSPEENGLDFINSKWKFSGKNESE